MFAKVYGRILTEDLEVNLLKSPIAKIYGRSFMINSGFPTSFFYTLYPLIAKVENKKKPSIKLFFGIHNYKNIS